MGILSHENLRNLCGKEIAVVKGVVAHQNTRLRSLFQYNQHTAVHHQIHIGTKDVYDLYCTVYHQSAWHINE